MQKKHTEGLLIATFSSLSHTGIKKLCSHLVKVLAIKNPYKIIYRSKIIWSLG